MADTCNVPADHSNWFESSGISSLPGAIASGGTRSFENWRVKNDEMAPRVVVNMGYQ